MLKLPTTPPNRLTYVLLTLAMAVAGTLVLVQADRAESAPQSFVAVNSVRLLDSRTGRPTTDGRQQGIGRVRAGETVQVDIAGRGGVPTTAASAMINVIAIAPSADGHITVFECGTTRPTTSSVNYQRSDYVSNSVFIKLSRGRACLYSQADTDLAVDLQGYATNDESIAPTASARLHDTRADGVTIDGRGTGDGRMAAGSTVEIQVAQRAGIPRKTSTAMLVLTAVEPEAAGLLIAFSCDRNRPDTTSLNYGAGITTGGTALVDLAKSGKVCVYSSASVHLVADTLAYIPSRSAVDSLSSHRLLDTRSKARTVDGAFAGTGPASAGTTTMLQVTGRGDVPGDAVGAMLKLAAVGAGTDGYLTAYDCDSNRGQGSSLNYEAGSTRSNLVFAPLSDDGRVCIFSLGTTDIVVDVEGTMGEPAPTDTTGRGSNKSNGKPPKVTTTTPSVTTLAPAPTTPVTTIAPAPTTPVTTQAPAPTTTRVVTLPPATTTAPSTTAAPTTAVPTIPPATTTSAPSTTVAPPATTVAPPSTTVAPPPRPDSGVPSVPGMSLVLNDEFDSLNTDRWYRYESTYGDGNKELARLRGQNVAVVDSVLEITAKRENFDGRQFTSGFVSTGKRGSAASPQPSSSTFYPRFGRYEMRAKVPHAQGLWPAFWLRHRDGASTAEVDIMEIFHSQIPGKTRAVVHLVDRNGNLRFNLGGGERAVIEDPRGPSGWHTYGVDILPEGDNVRFRYLFDGQEFGSFLDTDPGNWSTRYPGQGLFDVSINLAVGGDWTGHPDDAQLGRLDLIGRCAIGGTTTGYPNNCRTVSSDGTAIQRWDTTDPDPTFEIDWVRIYELD